MQKQKGIKQFWSSGSKATKATKAKTLHTHSDKTSQQEQPLWSCYESIDTLPLSVFIDCIVSQDLGNLVTSGTPTESGLSKAWLHLYSEYCQRINDPHIQELLEKRQQIDVLQSRLHRLGCLLQVASQVAAEEIAEAFAADGYLLDINAEEKAYMQQLRVIGAKLIPDSMKLDRLISEAGRPKDETQATRATFINSMLEISDHVKYRITIEDITTGEYCARIVRLRDYREAEQRAIRKNAA